MSPALPHNVRPQAGLSRWSSNTLRSRTTILRANREGNPLNHIFVPKDRFLVPANQDASSDQHANPTYLRGSSLWCHRWGPNGIVSERGEKRGHGCGPSGVVCTVLAAAGGLPPSEQPVGRVIGHYHLVGPCYVHGIMNGEALDGGYERHRFTIE